MTYIDNILALHQLMREYGLTRADVARELSVHISTVNNWFAPSRSFTISDKDLSLLTYILRERPIYQPTSV